MKSRKVLFFFAALAASSSFYGATPPDASINSVKAIVSRMAEDIDSTAYDQALKEELSTVIADYGIEGLSFVAMEEPVLMQALMISPSLGEEDLIKALLSQATSKDQLSSMLATVAASQFAIGESPLGAASLSSVLEGFALSSLSLSGAELDQLIDLAKIAALEEGETGVEVASRGRAAINALVRLRTKLARIFGEMSFLVKFIDQIISRASAHY